MSATRSGLRRLLSRVWPEELVAVAYLALLAGLFAWRGLPFSVVSLLGYYVLFLGTIAGMAVVPWLAVRAVRARRQGLRLRGAAADLGLLVRSLVGLLAILVGYTNLKSRLFAFHPTLFDRELARADDWLHLLGGDFLGWVLSTTHSPLWMAILDLVYFTAWLPLAIPFAVVFARGGGTAARRMLAALGFVYVVGGFLYLAVPSVGPAFFERARFAHLEPLFGWQTQQAMLGALEKVAAFPDSPAVAFFGIAAFPSLHLASTLLGVFAAWRWSRRLAWLLLAWNLAVAWSAVAWGWHYAIDFYPAALLAWGAWWIAGRLVDDGLVASRARASTDAGPRPDRTEGSPSP